MLEKLQAGNGGRGCQNMYTLGAPAVDKPTKPDFPVEVQV